MATEVYTVEEIKLQDGTEVSLKPLNIKGLKKFMKLFSSIQEVENEDEITDRLVDMAALCLQRALPELVEDRDALEDALDMPTIHKIIEVCGGIKLNDPNLMAAAEALATETQTA